MSLAFLTIHLLSIGSKDEIRRHTLDHFIKELKEYATLSGPTNDAACENCPAELDIKHMALDHGWLDQILSCLTDEALEAKRREFKDPRLNRKRRSSIDLTQQIKIAKRSFR